MDAKLYAKLNDVLAHRTTADVWTVPDALAFVACVLDNLIEGEPGTTADSTINKGIMLHTIRQIDLHHMHARARQANAG